MKDTCGVILPKHDASLSDDEEIHECILPEGHAGDHLIEHPRRGYVAWHPVEEPCPECAGAGVRCECFVWCAIPPSEAKELLKKHP